MSYSLSKVPPVINKRIIRLVEVYSDYFLNAKLMMMSEIQKQIKQTNSYHNETTNKMGVYFR